jgi:hypothetical protein
MVMLALVILLVERIVFGAISAWLDLYLANGDMPFSQVQFLYRLLYAVNFVIYCGALALLVFAVFTGRTRSLSFQRDQRGMGWSPVSETASTQPQGGSEQIFRKS